MVQFSETHKSNSHYDVQTSGICDLFDTKITILYPHIFCMLWKKAIIPGEAERPLHVKTNEPHEPPAQNQVHSHLYTREKIKGGGDEKVKREGEWQVKNQKRRE